MIKKWKTLLLIAILGLSMVAFGGYVKRAADPDKLFADLIDKMKAGKYEDIYDDSSDLLQLNADPEDFRERMSDALEKMKSADGGLNFERDKELEQRIDFMQRESDKAVGRKTPNNRILMIQKLGTGDNEVTVLLFWRYSGLFPEFNDLAVMPKKTERQDLRVKGITYTE